MAVNRGYAVERLQSMNEPSAENESRLNEVIDRAVPLEPRRQEILTNNDIQPELDFLSGTKPPHS